MPLGKKVAHILLPYFLQTKHITLCGPWSVLSPLGSPPYYIGKTLVAPILFQVIFLLPLSGRNSIPNPDSNTEINSTCAQQLPHSLCGTPLYSSNEFNWYYQLRVPLKSFLLNFCQLTSTLKPVSEATWLPSFSGFSNSQCMLERKEWTLVDCWRCLFLS